jgi:hypothetical protein
MMWVWTNRRALYGTTTSLVSAPATLPTANTTNGAMLSELRTRSSMVPQDVFGVVHHHATDQLGRPISKSELPAIDHGQVHSV